MSRNRGCHDDKAPATGWKRFVPLIVAAVLKKNDAGKATARSTAERLSTAATP
jgi:ribosome assembly protein YihI (activator of Der GTPase)